MSWFVLCSAVGPVPSTGAARSSLLVLNLTPGGRKSIYLAATAAVSTDTIRIGTGPFTKFSSFLGFELEWWTCVTYAELLRTGSPSLQVYNRTATDGREDNRKSGTICALLF